MFSLYKKTSAPYLILAVTTMVSTLLLWLPFLIKTNSINGIQEVDISFETIVRQWDGPLYIIPAKTLYDKNNPLIAQSPLGIDPKYFAAHLPFYPLTLKLFAPFTGYPKATVFSTLLGSVLFICFFYYFVEKLKLSKHPLALSVILLFFTPRFFVVRSVGAPEPWFMLFILVSLYFFIEKRFLLAGVFGGLAVITKTPGILLFAAYFLFFIESYVRHKRIETGMLWILLIPTALLGVFTLYQIQYGDFLAYFHSGDNLHLVFPPFSIFNYQKVWVDTGWLEDIIFLYMFYLTTILSLFFSTSRLQILIHSTPFSKFVASASIKTGEVIDEKQERIKTIFFFVLVIFFVSIISIQHRDISRYSLPILPLALITFERFFTSRYLKIALVLLLPALYAYAWNFMLSNTAPIADWTPFL